MHSHSELTERQIFQWLHFEANAQVENLLQWSFILMTICILWLIKPMIVCTVEYFVEGRWLAVMQNKLQVTD